jgi:hypothetical protein
VTLVEAVMASEEVDHAKAAERRDADRAQLYDPPENR